MSTFARGARVLSVGSTCPPYFLITEPARTFVSQLGIWSERFSLSLSLSLILCHSPLTFLALAAKKLRYHNLISNNKDNRSLHFPIFTVAVKWITFFNEILQEISSLYHLPIIILSHLSNGIRFVPPHPLFYSFSIEPSSLFRLILALCPNVPKQIVF